MTQDSQRQSPAHHSDYDGAWKEVLRCHFRGVLEKYFPAAAAAIDWQHAPQWSDKELSGEDIMQNRCVSCSG